MLFTTAYLLTGIVTSVASQSLPGLIDALKASGASKFAEVLQSDSETLDLYLSDQVKTVFAPADYNLANETLSLRDLSVSQRRAAAYQSSQATTNLESDSRTLPGSTFETNNKAPLLDGRPQRVVFDTRPPNITSPSRRWLSSPILRRQQANVTVPSLLRISSGLGKITNVIKGDIPYDGGIIHITDSFFTFPESLSTTSQATGQTAFAGLLSNSSSASTLDTTHSVTVFLPSNSAISSSNSTISSSQLVSDHVVAGFVGYLPDLKDGDVLKTQRGESLTINIRGGRYYVNGGLITQANLVLANGVAHVVDQVLKPTPAEVTGTASYSSISLAGVFGVVAYIAMMVMA
ncbi:hypothetical protein M426DRAFT_7290 [Hypoxylon sp. CI-4A]|nr:hypothetical protein M426DRAFT_7290 [Hypoxylon sp. CI-4A]